MGSVREAEVRSELGERAGHRLPDIACYIV